MNYKKQCEIDNKLEERIIKTAWGDAGFFEKRKVKKLAALYDNVNELLIKHQKTKDTFSSKERVNCPGDTREKILRQTSGAASEKRSLFLDIYKYLIQKPAAAALTAVVIISIIFASFYSEPAENEYSKEELQLAEKQLKQSLLLVSRMFEKSEDNLQKELFSGQHGKKLNKSKELVNIIFGGKYNEQNN